MKQSSSTFFEEVFPKLLRPRDAFVFPANSCQQAPDLVFQQPLREMLPGLFSRDCSIFKFPGRRSSAVYDLCIDFNN
jgi:hypothetical protein